MFRFKRLLAACPLCFGLSADLALDAETLQACSLGATEATEYEVEMEGQAPYYVTGCSVSLALFTDSRVRTRSRNPGTPWSGWSPWARRLHPTQEKTFTCLADFDLNRRVNGHDFITFRTRFILGACE